MFSYILAVVFLIFFLNLWITEPLNKLVTTIKHISKKKDYTAEQVEIKSSDEIGELGQSFNQMTDALKVAQNNLSAAHMYVENIINSMVDTLIVCNAQGVIEKINSSTRILLGYEEKELIGQSFHSIITKEDLFNWNDLLQNTQTGVVSDVDINYRTKNGEAIPISLTGSSMQDSDGMFSAIVMLGRDMRDSKLIAELNIMNERLEQSHNLLEKRIEERTQELRLSYQQLAHAGRLTALGEMATGIAHEINQPLNIINLAANVLKNHFADHDDQLFAIASITKILEQIERAANIINNMRSFARGGDDVFDGVNFQEPMERALSFFREQFRLHEIELKVAIGDNLPLVEQDPQKFEQVVVNLLSNARYAVEKKAEDAGDDYQMKITITLFYVPGKKMMVFEVTDNGIGMTDKEKDRCLEPFYTTKEVGIGTGLGMSIINNIVIEFGGRIEIESQKGTGSTLRVIIPIGENNDQREKNDTLC